MDKNKMIISNIYSLFESCINYNIEFIYFDMEEKKT